MNTIDDIEIIQLQSPDAELSVLEINKISMREMKRIFIVKPEANAKRGYHAHKELAQLLICLHGTCEVVCDDGKTRKSFYLKQSNEGLLIPPGIWGEQTYHDNDTILLVACDAQYDELDYIRDYDDFLKFRLEL